MGSPISSVSLLRPHRKQNYQKQWRDFHHDSSEAFASTPHSPLSSGHYLALYFRAPTPHGNEHSSSPLVPLRTTVSKTAAEAQWIWIWLKADRKLGRERQDIRRPKYFKKCKTNNTGARGARGQAQSEEEAEYLRCSSWWRWTRGDTMKNT